MMTRIMRRGLCLTGFILLSAVVRAEDAPVVPTDDGSLPAAALPVLVAPHDTNLHLSGRFDLSQEKSITGAWSASAITIKFHGTAINADLELGKNRVEVEVDGQPVKVLATTAPGNTVFNLATGLPEADHTVKLFKDTEPGQAGNIRFFGFQLNEGGAVLPAPIPARKMEVFGDSISAGYGNEGANEKEKATPANENAYWTYGAITARAFGADYGCYAWSGICLFPGDGPKALPDFYDKIIPEDYNSTLTWNFDEAKPDVVMINLGANDFNRLTVEEESWVKAYHAFMDRVRQNAPDAMIYVALGPTLKDDYPPNKPNGRSTCRQYLQRIVKECNDQGDTKVHFLEFDQQDASMGIGAAYHPNVKRNFAMAQQFINAIKADLGWQTVAGN